MGWIVQLFPLPFQTHTPLSKHKSKCSKQICKGEWSGWDRGNSLLRSKSMSKAVEALRIKQNRNLKCQVCLPRNINRIMKLRCPKSPMLSNEISVKSKPMQCTFSQRSVKQLFCLGLEVLHWELLSDGVDSCSLTTADSLDPVSLTRTH